MKKVIYGLGEAFNDYSVSEDFSLNDVIALVDKNVNLIGKTKYGYTVISPKALVNLKFDKVLVTTTKFFDEIKDELVSLGVDRSKIEVLVFNANKNASELLYWKKRYEAENNSFAFNFYRDLFLGIANEKNDSFMQDKVVADFGCGPRGSLAWTEAPKIKIGLDVLINQYMNFFGSCLKKHGMIYVNTDESNIPLPTGYVDILSTINSLDHVDNLDQIISELLRVMKSGALFLGCFNLNEPSSSTEPQMLTMPLLEEKLFCYFDVIDTRLAIKDETNSYANLINKKYVSTLAPNEIGVLWIKARKK